MNVIKNYIKSVIQYFKCLTAPTLDEQMRHKKLTPVSNKFGFDLGTPIDRIYTEDFLNKNSQYIKGIICEIAENTYTKKFGKSVVKSEVLHIDPTHKQATIIGDLTKHEALPKNYLDCFIATVTLNFIYDYKKAIEGIYKMLKGGGVAIITVAGTIQISRYDYERWGDYWRFTDMGIKRAVEEVFGKNVECQTYGNIYATMAEFQGIPAEKLSQEELFYHDPDYQILITIVAKKC